MDSKSRKKSSLLINPKFQWTLISYAAGVATLLLCTVYGFITYGFQQFIEIGTQLGLPKDHVYFQFIRMQEGTFNEVVLAIALVVGVVLIAGGIVVSHKIAGPVYRMQKELNLMSRENPVELKEIHFRKGDFFPELAEAFNALVRSSRGSSKGADSE
jgi:hypothetical protein